MDLSTGSDETYLRSLNSLDVAYDGQHLYYADSYNRLVVHDLQSGAEQAMDDVVMSQFLLTEQGIYFLNRRDNNALYLWDQKTVTKISDTTGTKLYDNGQCLWLMDTKTSLLYRIAYDGSAQESFVIDGYLCGISMEGRIYCYTLDDYSIYILDMIT